MADYEFTLPLHVMLKRKTKKDKKFSINLNEFRSAHHRIYTEAKEEYCRLMTEQLTSVDPIDCRIHCHYDYYAALDNGPDLDNFAGAAKKFFQDSMKRHEFIPDDNVHYVESGSEKYCGIDRKNPRIVVKVTILD